MGKFILSVFIMLATLSSSEILLNNIFINDIDVGGLNYEEAMEKLSTIGQAANEEVVVYAEANRYVYTLADFGAGYDFDTAVNEALEYCRRNFLGRMGLKIALKLGNGHHIQAEFIYDDEKVSSIVSEIAKAENIPPIESNYALKNGEFEIAPSQVGMYVDESALKADIACLFKLQGGGEVKAEISYVPPKFDQDDYEASCDLLSSYITPFNPTLTERTTNLIVASNFLNNSVILPGEVFSTSEALRARTAENGYVRAGQITNGEPDLGFGGGICQISSTLYMAALYAELPIVERRSHSLMVSYMGPATDAAIAEGAIDMKFENNTGYPMLIESIIRNGRHIVNIYGHESRPYDRSITFEAVLTETTPSVGEKLIEDPMLPAGITEVAFPGMNGAKYELYKIVTQNGVQERVRVNISDYRPMQRVIRVGTAQGFNGVE